MYIKMIISGLSFLMITAYVTIRVIPAYNPDVYNGYKVIQAYQKVDTIGHTRIHNSVKQMSWLVVSGI